jgi:hypothetical protein
MLAGQELQDVPKDDIQFLLDLGLCVMSPEGGLAIANPIYREILPRMLAAVPMASLPHPMKWLASSKRQQSPLERSLGNNLSVYFSCQHPIFSACSLSTQRGYVEGLPGLFGSKHAPKLRERSPLLRQLNSIQPHMRSISTDLRASYPFQQRSSLAAVERYAWLVGCQLERSEQLYWCESV